MKLAGQSQRAGQGAHQYQAGGDIHVHQGVTEERAHQIALQTARGVIAEFAVEATELIQTRIDALDQRVIDQLASTDSLDAFADPAFLRSYKKAQEGAASSDREMDYDMLAALLAKRIDTPQNRPVIAGIDRAIEIMDRVDSVALRGLTVVYAFEQWSPNSPLMSEGLAAMDTLCAALLDGPLPEGPEWTDHLDVLDAVRVGSLLSRKNIETLWGETLVGYVSPGVPAESAPEYVGGDLSDLPWGDRLIDHELKPGFRRLAAANETSFRLELEARGGKGDFIDKVLEQARDTLEFGKQDSTARKALRSRIQDFASLSVVADWWDKNSESYFQITAVGRALARANAFRLDPERQLPRD